MSFNAQRLYELLPAVYRIRDAEAGEPLRELLAVIAEQVGVLEEDLEQLYDDQFIETCAEWVVPYIGDLIGYRALHNVAPKVGNQRAEVAHTIGFRRRKGTAAMLEQLARDVTGWNARIVEFFLLLGWTQYMNHTRPASFYAPDMRQWEPLENINGPFDTVAHTVDVRRIATGRGKHNIPNIGVFLWRLNAYSLSKSPAVQVDAQRFRFDPLGKDTPLFTKPDPEDEITHLAEPINTPNPISRRVLDKYLAKYYGPGKSIFIEGIDIGDVRACNLSDAGGGTWAHTPQAGKVAIDPVLGRIALGDAQATPPLVTFHYGFSADMGGGEYERADTFDALLQPVEKIPAQHATIQGALNAVTGGGVAEISDSGRYQQTPSISANAGMRVELRAANEHRPTVVLGGDLLINGGADSEVTLNGLLISGGALRVNGSLRLLRLRHCTLAPSASPSLIADLPNLTVEIDRCVVGGLRIAEGAQVKITGSIVDGTGETAVAFAATDNISAGGGLQIVDSTVIGKVHTREMRLASNTIFMSGLAAGDAWTAPIRSEKRQEGCVRFSFVPLNSVVPRRYRCQPTRAEDALRMRPQFTSLRHGDPGYCQLAQRTAAEIRAGADDEAEMGVFHKLYQPQRETNLRVRLEEYLRFGLEAGFFYVT
jgi:hypothetical protein